MLILFYRRYGGIFLENNVRLLRNLHTFLKPEMTVVVRPKPENEIPIELTDYLIIAHKDARFLNLWLRTYHEYDVRESKHVMGNVMKMLLKNSRKYTHILENDLPDGIDTNSDIFKISTNLKKYFFVVVLDDKSQCFS